MEEYLPHMSLRHNESVLRRFVHDAFSTAVLRDRTLKLQFTCVRADDFSLFVDSYGHAARFEAPQRLFDAIRVEARSDNVFRCFQDDGFATTEPIAINALVKAFLEFPLVYTKLLVDVDAPSHDRCWRSAEWILMYVHRGIAEATTAGTSLNCYTPPEFAT